MQQLTCTYVLVQVPISCYVLVLSLLDADFGGVATWVDDMTAKCGFAFGCLVWEVAGLVVIVDLVLL